jgi:predicted patatin/cPLA2 family phospholipase
LGNRSSNTAALIVEGGAMRGVFSTGVLDGFLDANFNPFDLYLGVSSGSTNIAAYLAEMNGRNHIIYTDFSLRQEFIQYVRFFRGGHLIDLDWLWDITIREIRLDLQTIYAKQKPFIVVLTDVQSGRAVYKLTSAQDLEHVIKSSCAVPLYYRHYLDVDGRPMTDGGLADALPVREAIRLGARKIMVIRSRHQGYLKKLGLSEYLMRWHVRRYPALQRAMAHHIQRYNESVALIRQPPDGVSIIEVCPPGNYRVKRLGRNRLILQEGYELGRALAEETVERWRREKT